MGHLTRILSLNVDHLRSEKYHNFNPRHFYHNWNNQNKECLFHVLIFLMVSDSLLHYFDLFSTFSQLIRRHYLISSLNQHLHAFPSSLIYEYSHIQSHSMEFPAQIYLCSVKGPSELEVKGLFAFQADLFDFALSNLLTTARLF